MISALWLLPIGGLLGVGGWLLYLLTVQNGRLLIRLEAVEQQLVEQGILPDPQFGGLAIGTSLTDFSLPLLNGGTTTLSRWRGRKLLVAFVNPECSFSRDLVERLSSRGAAAANADPLPLLVSTGDAASNKRWFQEFPVPYPVLLQERAEVSSLYKLRGTPTGYLLDENGATASGALIGAGPLLERIDPSGTLGLQRNGKGWRPLSESRIARDGLKAGTPAPNFTLPALDGGVVSLDSFRGKNVLLVFSDPGCAPCMRLAPELERLHRETAETAILMISRGTVEANQQKASDLGLTFPIVLQQHWEVSRAYAMFATPIGYRVDENGVLASDVAVGPDAILNLAMDPAALVGSRS